MVNKVVLNYISKNYKKYTLEALKKKVISTGYSEADFEEALIALNLKKPVQPIKSAAMPVAKPTIKPTTKSVAKTAVKTTAKPLAKTVVKPPIKSVAAPSASHSKWLRISAISGILFIVLMILFGLFRGGLDEAGQQSVVSFVISLLALVSLVVFFYGFVILGKKYDQKLVKIASWILVIFGILLVVLQVVLMVSPSILGGESLIDEVVSQAQADFDYSALIATFLIYLIVLIVIVVAYLVLGILFGIGLLKLKEKLQYAKIAGILHIIGSALLIIGIGVFVLLVALVMEILLLFKASKQI